MKYFTMMNKTHFTLYLLFFALIPAFTLSAQQRIGFTADEDALQATVEELLLELPNSAEYKQHLQALTAEPHPAGSDANNRVADYMADVMEKAGLAVDRYPYDIYMPTGPGAVTIELVKPIRLPLNNQEYILEEDPFSADERLRHGWNSYSGSGDVTAPVVYVNYGRKEDFEKLAELGVSLEGKIAVARYGGNFRGFKAKYAEAAGAAGLIIYTDPEDSGYMKGLEYPEGKQYNESTIQRGSVLTLDWTGDPLTPFEPALPLDHPETPERLDPSEVAFHTIPVAPIPYGSAREILSRMSGQPVPQSWQGGLPFTYRVEGGEGLHVRLHVEQPRDFVRVQNVIGTLEGSEFPDEWIILGCHFDAWTFGATDPNSGTAMLLSLAEALGELAAKGYRPRRTIKIAHWDAEEHGILGSTEWVEQLKEELELKAVAYFNADGACSGLNFRGASSPSLKELMIEATKVVPYPKGDMTVYEHWRGDRQEEDKGPRIGNLGGGSDHLGFYAHIGVPSLSAGMGGPTMYHSAYDNFHWYSTVGEPDFVAGPTVARVFGVMALRLANASLLPYDLHRYAVDLEEHLHTAAEEIKGYYDAFTIDGLMEVVERLESNAEAVESLLEQHLRSGKLKPRKLREINSRLIQLERSFIDEDGMAYGRWYRSLYASSDPYSGYASWMLPGLLYEASQEAVSDLSEWKSRYRQAFERLNEQLAEMKKMLE